MTNLMNDKQAALFHSDRLPDPIHLLAKLNALEEEYQRANAKHVKYWRWALYFTVTTALAALVPFVLLLVYRVVTTVLQSLNSPGL